MPRHRRYARVGAQPSDGDTLSPAMRAKLEWWNAVMAIVHLTWAVMIVTLGLAGRAPYTLRVERSWRRVNTTVLPPIITNPCCGGSANLTVATAVAAAGCASGDAVYQDDVFEWFDCIRSVREVMDEELVDDDTRARLYVLDPTLLFEVPVWFLLFTFELITALVHGLLATAKRGCYEWYVARRMQPYRWFEYSITSSIMLLAIFSLSRISDVYQLSGLFLCSVFLCLGGGLLFEVFDYAQTDAVTMPSQVKGLLGTLKWLLFGLSWAAFVLHYVCLFDAFYTAIEPYFELPSAHLWEQLFLFIKVLNFSILGAYFSFPVLHVLQVTRAVSYAWAERGYMVLSLVSKTLLTMIIFVAAMRRRRD